MDLAQLLLQIGAILLLGRLLARLIGRWGQPSVIAEIIAGIALGPSVLGALWPAGMQALFPASSMGTLGVVAQLGLVFFMFLVGLEFDPRLLRGQGRISVAISNAGILVPFALGIALAWPLHADLAPPGVERLPFALFMGTAMSVTAFPVLARILTERRLIRTRVGAIALAAAAVDDVSAWCLLALVVGVASAHGVGPALWTTALAVGWSAAVWLVIRPALARMGPRSGQVVSTDLVAVVFLLVIGSALMTEWIGVHALFGSFLMGTAMPRQGGLATVLVEKMEDFVTVVLLPLFFAYSGLRTEIGLLSTPWDWTLCAIIIVVASLGKAGGTFFVGRLSGMAARDAAALGVLMNTRGLMELVVLNVGLDLGVISGRLFAMMVIMALVTTWATAPLLRRLYPPSRALADEAVPAAPVPAAEGGVLICVSDPASARSLLRLGAELCQPTGVELWALHLRPTERPQDYLREAPDGEGPLVAVSRAAAELQVRCGMISFPSAEPAEDIVRMASLKGVSMVVLGMHRSALGWDPSGGTTAEILRDCHADVAVLVDRGLGELRRVALRPGQGEHALAAHRLVERLLRADDRHRVEPEGGQAELIVGPWEAGASWPMGEVASCLLVRAGRVG